MAPSGFLLSEHLLVNAAGREYRLRRWRPASPGPAGNIPTLLLLDGQYLDATLEAALRELGSANLQVASLGYRVAERKAIAPWRAHDYTPAAPGAVQCDPRMAAWPCGGADALLSFLKEQVLPLLHQDMPGESGSVALFGHSYAGLFSLYCWLEAPTLFERIYAASPSLWWYWPHMLNLLQSRRTLFETAAVPPIHLMVGADERWRRLPAEPGAERPPGISTVPFAEQFCATQRALGGDKATLSVFEGQAHGPMLHYAARFALADIIGTPLAPGA